MADTRIALREAAMTCNGRSQEFRRHYSAPCEFSRAPDVAERKAVQRLNAAERFGYKLERIAASAEELLTLDLIDEIKSAMANRLIPIAVFDLTYATAHEAAIAQAARLSSEWSHRAVGYLEAEQCKSLAVWLAGLHLPDLYAAIEVEYLAVQSCLSPVAELDAGLTACDQWLIKQWEAGHIYDKILNQAKRKPAKWNAPDSLPMLRHRLDAAYKRLGKPRPKRPQGRRPESRK